MGFKPGEIRRVEEGQTLIVTITVNGIPPRKGPVRVLCGYSNTNRAQIEKDIKSQKWPAAGHASALVATVGGRRRKSITFAVSSGDYWGWNWFNERGSKYLTELVFIDARSSDTA